MIEQIQFSNFRAARPYKMMLSQTFHIYAYYSGNYSSKYD